VGKEAVQLAIAITQNSCKNDIIDSNSNLV